MPMFRICAAFLLASAALAQDAENRLGEARRLRAEGVAAYEKKDFGPAADRYEEAVAAYDAFHGADSAEAARETVVLRRAVLWCRANAGQFDRLQPQFKPLYDDVLVLGGAPGDENSARGAVGAALAGLAHKGDSKGMEALHAAWTAAWKAAAEAARADGARAEAMKEFLARCEEQAAHALADRFEARLILGRRDDALADYRAGLDFWVKGGDLLQAAWVAQNAFYTATQHGAPADVAVFFSDALVRLRARPAHAPMSYLLFNARTWLAKLESDGRSGDAVTFLEGVLAAAKQPDAFLPGLDEGTLRLWLARFLGKDPARAAANGDALAALAAAAGDPWLESAGARLAADALLASGKAEEALKRADRAVAAAAAADSPNDRGQALVTKARVLTALAKHADADAAVSQAVEAFGAAENGPGASAALNAGLANARAAKDDALAENYRARGASAAGGLGGESCGRMSAADLWARVQKAELEEDLLEISREDDILVFRNLLDGTVAKADREPRLHYVNVSGILLQVRGPEVCVVNILDRAAAPGTPGETAMTSGGERVHTGPEFEAFALRALVPAKGTVRVTSGLRVYRVAK